MFSSSGKKNLADVPSKVVIFASFFGLGSYDRAKIDRSLEEAKRGLDNSLQGSHTLKVEAENIIDRAEQQRERSQLLLATLKGRR